MNPCTAQGPEEELPTSSLAELTALAPSRGVVTISPSFSSSAVTQRCCHLAGADGTSAPSCCSLALYVEESHVESTEVEDVVSIYVRVGVSIDHPQLRVTPEVMYAPIKAS